MVNSEWGDPKLMGLSRDSIDSWLANSKDYSRAQRVYQVVAGIAIKLRIEADSSRVVFDESALETSLSSDFLLLESLLRADSADTQ